jgi:predicted nucleic acid-binding Zn ribbon protein
MMNKKGQREFKNIIYYIGILILVIIITVMYFNSTNNVITDSGII